MMGQIHYNAEKVLAWLGPYIYDSDGLFDQLTTGKFRLSGITLPVKTLWDIGDLDYWQRARTVQEVVLAKDVVFYCRSVS